MYDSCVCVVFAFEIFTAETLAPQYNGPVVYFIVVVIALKNVFTQTLSRLKKGFK